MPTVPRYVQTERPRGYQNVTPTRGGEAVAGAWQQAGKALQGAGNTLNDMALDMQRRQNEAVAQEAMTAYEEKRHVFTAGVVENKKGKNALGDKDTPSVYDQSVKWHADTVASLLEDKTPAQKRLLEPYFAKRGQSMDEWAFTYYRKQWDTFETEQFNSAKKAQLQRAKDDPSQLEAAMANIGQLEFNYNSARGLPPEKTELAVRAAWDDAGKEIAQGYLDMNDPNAADAFLDKYEKQLSAGTVKALRGKSKTKREAMAEKAERLKEKAAKEKAKAEIQEAADGILESTKWFKGSDEEREAKATELCEAIEDPERRAKVWGKVKSQLAFEKAKSNAQASREVRAFLELDKREGWSRAQYDEALTKANISDKAKERLEDASTRSPRETYKNRSATMDLLELIDLGAERGGIDPGDTDAIEDYAWRNHLTTAQTNKALKHAESGGAKGQLSVSMVKTAANMLFPNDPAKAKQLATDLYDQVGDQLEPGKKPTLSQVRAILSALMQPGEWASDSNGFTWGRGADMTWGEALKREEVGTFFADVPEADRRRIEELQREDGRIEVSPASVSAQYLKELKRGR